MLRKGSEFSHNYDTGYRKKIKLIATGDVIIIVKFWN